MSRKRKLPDNVVQFNSRIRPAQITQLAILEDRFEKAKKEEEIPHPGRTSKKRQSKRRNKVIPFHPEVKEGHRQWTGYPQTMTNEGFLAAMRAMGRMLTEGIQEFERRLRDCTCSKKP